MTRKHNKEAVVIFDPVGSDPLSIDKLYPPFSKLVTFLSDGEQLIGHFLIAQGRGPHRTIVLLHGFPGVLQQFDMAHTFSRMGWNVLIFHYRGSWGSSGTFSFTHVLEDVHAALRFLRTPETCESYRINPSNIVLIGHSMGGFVALLSAVADPSIRSVASLAGFNFGIHAQMLQKNPALIDVTIRDWRENLLPIQGSTTEGLVEEVLTSGEKWNILQYADILAERTILLVGARLDADAPIEIHHDPLVSALEEKHGKNLRHGVFEADHAFSEKRIAVTRLLLSWLEEQVQ